nr:hypothetical protein [Tanacetum cinerariifolium]
MVAILEKSDAAQGFEQIIDFLSGSYIYHALTVNPHVYISCIKQFWNTDVVKHSGDVTRLQALVDKKSIVISEEVVREILQLNDAEGVVCLPNKEIFAGLAQEIATEVVPPTSTSPSPSYPVIPSLPPHQSPSPPQPQAAEGSSHLVQQVLDKCSAFVLRVKGLETANAAQQLEIIKLKARVKKLERLNKVKSSKLRRLKKVGTSQHIESSDDVENVFNQGRISVDMETDEGIELEVDQEKSAEVEGRHADTQTEIYNIDLDHSSKVLTETPTVKDKGKGILIKDPKPMTKKDQVEMDAEFDANMKFLFKTREEMEKEDEEIIKRINETPAQKAAKRRKLSEEAQEADDLRGRLEIVQDEDDDDDVFVEAILLAQKVLVVDYQVVVIDNKPRYKIIRADGTHQFYISFTPLLKNFDKEDLETL